MPGRWWGRGWRNRNNELLGPFQYYLSPPIVLLCKVCHPLEKKGSFSVLSWSPEGEWSSIVHTIPWGPMGSEITTIFIEKENLVPRGFRQSYRGGCCVPLWLPCGQRHVHVCTHMNQPPQFNGSLTSTWHLLKEVCCGIF